VGKILLFLIWLVGIAVILGTAAVLARRARAGPAAAGSSRFRIPPRATAAGPAEPVAQTIAWFLVFVLAGVAVVFAIMALLGLIVVHAGPPLDRPVWHWVGGHQLHLWAREMKNLTKIGDTYTTRAAAVTAAVCLAVSWRRMRWLPPVALGTLIVVHRVLTHAIHLVVTRVGPPGFPHGTFPSGGSERCIVFYGLIGYLIWREFSGRRPAAIWAGAVVACLAFNEGYSRLYLGMHWTTDVLSGWLYGGLLLAVFIAAVRWVAGPARIPATAVTAPTVATEPSPELTARHDPLPAAGEPAATGQGTARAWKDQQ